MNLMRLFGAKIVLKYIQFRSGMYWTLYFSRFAYLTKEEKVNVEDSFRAFIY